MARKKARVTAQQAKTLTDSAEIADILNLGDLEQLPVSMLPIERIDPNPYQPRQFFDPERITELATAIQANGFLGSLVAREVAGRYQLAFGERRLRAATEAGLDRIPLHISPFSDEQMAEVAITENVNREDLTPIEEAQGYQILAEQFQYSLRNIGQRVGKSYAHISRMLSLLTYNDVRLAVEQARITASAASELVKVEDEVKRRRLLDEVAAKGLSRDALRTAVKLANESPPEPAPPSADSNLPDEATPSSNPTDSYDPVPQLAAALNTIRRIQRHRLGDVLEGKRGDAQKIVKELEFLLEEIKTNL